MPTPRLHTLNLIPEPERTVLEDTLKTTPVGPQALVYIERFVRGLQNRPEVLRFCLAEPRRVEMLLTLFAGSQFLSELLLVHPEYFQELVEARSSTSTPRRLTYRPEAAEMFQATRAVLATAEGFSAQVDALRRFQRRELLRIGACDLLGLWDLPTVTTQLSHLADGLVRAALEAASHATNTPAAGFAVMALGKLGGEELNYSSDIDLLFLASSNPSRYDRLGIKLMDALRSVTAEGFLYRVDMRLRPWGRTGPLVSSRGGYLTYLEQSARLWEKQALLKARFIAGNRVVGDDFLRAIQPYLFSTDAAAIRADVHDMKQRIEAQLRKRGRDWGEVKLGKGSIRDVEFVTQAFQLVHGNEHPVVRSSQTLDALKRLHQADLLPRSEYRILTDGYTFLRTIEHYLQLMNDRQTHTLPSDQEALLYLARRLGFEGDDADTRFLERYDEHTTAIRSVYQRYLAVAETQDSVTAAEVDPHLKHLAPIYVLTFNDLDIARHAALAAQVGPNRPVIVEADALDDDLWRVTIVGFDALGAFSAICGLLFAYGFDIQEGHIFTYDGTTRGERKIVDVLTVRPVEGPVSSEAWASYTTHLEALVHELRAGDVEKAQGKLARRVATAIKPLDTKEVSLAPVSLKLDNETAEDYTVLHIEAADTPGFLYELANALALNRINITRMRVSSTEDQVRDTLYVTDAHGHKITSPEAQRRLRLATVLVKHFTHLLPAAPDPESALLHFRSFLVNLFRRPDWPDVLTSMERPDVLDALTRLLGVSDFLWEDFLRMQYENLFPVVRDTQALVSPKSKHQLQHELDDALEQVDLPDERRQVLNAYKDREMFRIDMRYILGHVDLDPFSEELTDLAEVVVDSVLRLCLDERIARHGHPRLQDGEPCPITVCALGKCGGRELGFASDIELMFLYEGAGMTDGPKPLSNAEFYNRVVRDVVEAIRAKQEGIFELDLRLRPYGRAGSLAVSLQAFRTYFAPDGPAWPYERQLLVRLRPIAGSPELAQHVSALRTGILIELGRFDVSAMRAMRERQVRHLVTPGTLNAKYSPGGLVDVEYLVQGLQIAYARRVPALLNETNTRQALNALAEAHLLQPDDHAALDEALTILRHLVEALRMVRGHAKDLTVPPNDTPAFTLLTRRLPFAPSPTTLHEQLHHHMSTVQHLNQRLLPSVV